MRKLCLAHNKRGMYAVVGVFATLVGIVPGAVWAAVTCDTWYEVVSKSQIIPVLRGWKSCYFWAQESPNPLISGLDYF